MLFSIAFNQVNAQWESDVRLTSDDSLSFVSRGNTWSVAAHSSNVHAVWWDNRDGNYEIYYKRSADAGATWESDMRLTNNPAISGSSSIAVSGDTVHVVWNDNRTGLWGLYYKRSTDVGMSWSQDTLLTPNGNIGPTTICSDGSALHVAWSDARDGNDEIYSMHSSDGGTTWSADSRLTFDSALSEYPSIAASGSTVHVAWWDSRDIDWELYYKRSTDGGSTWEADERLTDSPGYSQSPSIGASGSSVHVVWFDDRDGNQEIYYKRSTDAGLTWSADSNLTNDPASQGVPCIAVSGSNIHTVWNDYRDGNFEIYYKFSTDGGTSWSSDERLTTDAGTSWSPSLAVSGTAINVVWGDTRDGNDEIYYKANPTGNPTAIIEPVEGTVPSSFELFQNHPNPFNPTTTIRFSLPRSQFVTLKVFDSLGRQVALLVSGSLSPGTYDAEWDARGFSSGVYLYRLQTATFTQTAKLVLLR